MMMAGMLMGGAVPRLKYTATNIWMSCEGNSLTAGAGSSGAAGHYPAQMQLLAPINNQFTVNNAGSSGQTIQDMRSSSGPQFDYYAGLKIATKKCIGIIWEGTNSICQSSNAVDGATAADLMRQYVAERLAANPGVILVLITTLPRQGGYFGNTLTNQYLNDYNRILLANYKAWGAKAIVDVRQPGSPWAFTGYTSADFTAGSVMPYWAAGETGSQTHCSDAGYALIAQWVANTLTRLPAR